MRVLDVSAWVLAALLLIAALLTTGCLDPLPSGAGATQDGGHVSATSDGGRGDGGDDGGGDGGGGDGGTPTMSNTPPGTIDCYGAAACDPATAFCIKYYAGSQSAPGAIASGPACYEPSDTCANQGQAMDCGCIRNDAVLGPACAGGCVDNGNGTYVCFAQ
jgi:hypothetical protein